MRLLKLPATLLPMCLALLVPAQGAELKPAALEAFDQYVRATERRMDSDLRTGFLLPDRWAPEPRDQAYQQLRRGHMLIERLDAPRVPGALVHHWAGIVFIPGASLQQTLGVIQDYDRHHDLYAPDVVRSRLLSRQADDFRIFLRLQKHKVVTTVLDTEYDVHFARLGPHRAYSRSHSTRIAEVENPGRSDERQLPVGHDHGYLWALEAYWRFLEADDGVFVQCEAVSLTRDVPAGLGWLIGPFIQSIPRESLSFTLETTRKAVQARRAATLAAGH